MAMEENVKNIRFRLWMILLIFCFGICLSVTGADAVTTIGGVTAENNLQITVYDDGSIELYRYNSGVWYPQVFSGDAKGSRLQISGTGYYLGYFWCGTVCGTTTLVSNQLIGSNGNHIQAIWNAGGIQITLDLIYNSGDLYYTLQWTLQNSSGTTLSDIRFFHGQDTYFNNSDQGAGFWDPVNQAIGVQKYDNANQLIRMSLQSVTADAYESQYYGSVSSNVSAGALTGTIDPSIYTDNGYALEWRNASMPNGAVWTITAFEKMADVSVGDVLVTAPTLTECPAGSSCDLTYTVQNLTTSPVQVTLSAAIDLAGWGGAILELPPTPIQIPASGSQQVIVRVTVPSGTAADTEAHVTLFADDGSEVIPSDTGTVRATTHAGHILDNNTVALWRLNEAVADSNAVDETGNYHLTQFGSPDIISGKADTGRLLNGSTKFFQRPGDTNLGTVFNGDWTYEGWVYLDPVRSGWSSLFIYNGLAFSFNQPDTILAEVGVRPDSKIYWHQWHTTGTYTEIASNITLQTGQYYHVAVSRTAQGDNLFTYRLYVNGTIDTTTTNVAGLSYAVPGASHYIGLGCYTSISGFGVGGNVLNGRLDDTRISSIARTDAEILESYQRVTTAEIILSNLSHTYDGISKTASVTTIPAGLTVDVTYNGSAAAPTAAGSYAVIATINDANYQGSASGTLTISRRTLTVTADPKTKVVGAADPALTYQVTSGSLVNGDALSGSLSRDAGESLGVYAINQGTLTGEPNYSITFIGDSLTIKSADTYVYTVSKTGSGSVTSSPAGLTCEGSSCSGEFPANAKVKISFKPARGSRVVSVTVNGVNLGPVKNVTLKNLKKPPVIVVIFSP